MLYDDLLKKMETCPFCAEVHKKERTVFENHSAYLTYALVPYHKHHLLIIPKKHRLLLLQATFFEQWQINRLIKKGVRLLRALGYSDLSVLVRDGNLGKSIDHLHYHIVPNVYIGDVVNDHKPRKLLTKKQIEKTLADFEEVKKKI